MKFDEPSIGRVVIDARLRGTGLGPCTDARGHRALRRRSGRGRAIRISAQAHLQRFYAQHGLSDGVGDEYLDDGIPHVEMLKECDMNCGTHEVINQSTPLVDVNLFDSNRALRDALDFNLPDLRRQARCRRWAPRPAAPRCSVHARLANVHTPELHTHDRFGHRIDQVEFHPSYHALLGSALRHGLHGTPWSARRRARTSSARPASCSSPSSSRRCCARCR